MRGLPALVVLLLLGAPRAWGQSAPLDPFMGHPGIPGATVAVVHGDRDVWLQGYGEANTSSHEPVLADRTLFRVASVGKLLVWTVVMRLVEQGRLTLDADIRPLLGEALQRVLADGPPLTLLHLMAHTGGFEVPERLWPTGPPLDSLEAWLRERSPPRVRPPGELSAYSDYGTCLAEYLVERVTGRPFEEVVREEIFIPLGMDHSVYRQALPLEPWADLALGHVWTEDDQRPQVLRSVRVAAGGSLLTTAQDMARFMRAHLPGAHQGPRLLREDTLERMHRQHFTHDPRLSGWAHGFMEFHVQGRRLIGHTGDAYFFTSLLVLDPERDWGFFVSYNGLGPGNIAQRARLELLAAVLARDFPAPPEHSAPPVPDPDTDRFAGGYQTTWRTLDTAESSLGWRQEIHVLGGGPGALRIWRPGEGVRRWLEVAPRLFRPAEPPNSPERIAFREDATGRGSHLFLENRPLEAFVRAPWYDTAPVTYALLAGCILLFASAVVRGPVERALDPGFLATLGLLHLLFLAGFTWLLVRPPARFGPGDVPWLLGAAQACALGGVALTPGALFVVGRVWKVRAGRWTSRVRLTAGAGAAALFALWLHHWHLLDWHLLGKG